MFSRAMTEMTRMLVAFDGSEAAAGAIRAAAALFPHMDAVVVCVRGKPLTAELARGALPDSVIAGGLQEFEREAATRASAIAEHGSAIARASALRAFAVVQVASAPWRGLCAAAEEHAASIVVCGSRGQGGFSRAVLGSTSSSMLHHAPLPVLVVPAGAGALDGPLLIGYDGSADARAAIAMTARLLPGRGVIVVHGWSSSISRSFVGESLLTAPVAEIQEITHDIDAVFAGQAADVAEAGAAFAREHGLAARALAVEASPGAWRALSAAARSERAALVVTGCRGRGALASTVLGSVSAGLVHNADGPVLVVRPPRAGAEPDA